MAYVADLTTTLTTVTPSMDISTKIQSVVSTSLAVDSVYMRAKDTFKELMDGTKLTEVEYAQAASGFVTALASQLTETAISTALEWAKQEKSNEIVLAKTLDEIKGLQLQNELTSKQIDIAVIEAAKATSENLNIQANTSLINAQKLKTDADTLNVQGNTLLVAAQKLKVDGELLNLAAETAFIAKKGAQIDQDILQSQSQVNMQNAQIAKINAEIILLAIQDDIAFAELEIKQAEVKKIPEEIALLTAQVLLTTAQKDKAIQEGLATVQEVQVRKATARATIASSIRENGEITASDSDGMPISLSATGLKWSQIKVAEANKYSTIADAYRKSGIVSISEVGGVVTPSGGDDAGYTNEQKKFATRQIKSFEDSKRSHAANAASQMIGQLYAVDANPDDTIVAYWKTAMGDLTTNTL